MKKTICLAVILVLVLSLIGCQKNSRPGITVNDISFERVALEDLDSKTRDIINESKEKSGYKLIESEEKGYYYLAVFAGEKPTAGYSIRITKVLDSEGVTKVMVEETVPGKDVMVAQVLTYPMDIVKLTGITDNVKLEFDTKEGTVDEANKDSQTSELIETQIVEAEYVGQIDNNSIEVKIEDGAVALRLTETSKERLAELKPKTGDIVRFEVFRNEHGQETVLTLEKTK